MKPQNLLILLILMIGLSSITYGQNKCEQAMNRAATIGMKFAVSGRGYKATIIADKNVTILCKG